MRYKRLTKRIADGEEAFLFHSSLHEGVERLAELEDKIESGELCDREEVRKETAREILQMLIGHEMRDKGAHMSWVIVKQDVTFIAEKYGIDLFEKTEQVGNPDKLGGENND